jgi:hypothetical protein
MAPHRSYNNKAAENFAFIAKTFTRQTRQTQYRGTSIPFGPICVVNHRKGELQILALALALFPAHHMGRGIGV